jgi:hypothetical protein
VAAFQKKLTEKRITYTEILEQKSETRPGVPLRADAANNAYDCKLFVPYSNKHF